MGVAFVRMKADLEAINSGEDDVHYRAVMVVVILVHDGQQLNVGNARSNDLRRSQVVVDESPAQGTVLVVLLEVHTVATCISQESILVDFAAFLCSHNWL